VATLDLNLLCRGYLPSVNLVIRNEQVVGSILTTGSLSQKDLEKQVTQSQPSFGQNWANS
jgi:hypothetical protein